jgi:hypothetical protein
VPRECVISGKVFCHLGDNFQHLVTHVADLSSKAVQKMLNEHLFIGMDRLLIPPKIITDRCYTTKQEEYASLLYIVLA